MSKADDFLKVCKQHCGEWVCSLHTTGSNQPAAIFREVKKRGYSFEEVSPNRWAITKYCPTCGQETTHYKLLKPEPVLTQHERLTIDANSRKRTLAIFDNRDAFTGASISSVAEIDHKIPWTRLDGDIDIRTLTDSQIRQHFQLLTREHNLLKDRACGSCKETNVRPPFFGISFWYEGDCHYNGTCKGCGWYDGIEWRKAVNEKLNK